MEDLVALTAREAVARLAAGAVSPLELIDAAERRIAETDPQINAIPTRCFDRARDRARDLAANPPTDTGPGYLHGLPLAIKDLNDVAGVRTTHGSPIFADNVPETSDILVQQLERNGGIVIGKANTPEFGAGANTFNEVFGTTSNPWDTTTTCGGSSGGSAAALAAGQVWLAAGSDLGGSLRIPASFCGVVGFRPSPGRVAHSPGSDPFNSLPIQGPMARDTADTALMLDAMAGFNRWDPLSLPAPTRPFLEAATEARPPARVAFSPDLGLVPVHADVRAACEAAARRFTDCGAAVEADCIDFSDARDTFQALRGANFVAGRQHLLDQHRDQLKPDVIWNIESGLALSAADIGVAIRARADLFRRTVAFFERYDLLFCPTVLTPPFDHKIRYLTEFEGHKFDNYVDWLILTFVITLTSCPTISVPCGFTQTGLPVGLQIMGPPRADAEVLAAAALVEQTSGLADAVPIDPRPQAIPPA